MRHIDLETLDLLDEILEEIDLPPYMVTRISEHIAHIIKQDQ